MLQSLTSRKQFHRVSKQGIKFVSKTLVMLAINRSDSEDCTTRFGIIATKRLGSAVVRNRVKRRIRALTREFVGQFPQGHDVVFIARHSLAKSEFQQLRSDISFMLNRLHSKPLEA